MDDGPLGGGARGVRHAVPPGADLPRPAAGELGPEIPVGDLRPRGRERRGEGQPLAHPLSRSRASRAGSSRVATTRPETMLGDTGVAVHPDDPRYSDLVGKHAILPLVGRRIPIVADSYSDPEKGTGAVKITPAHDFNDFGVGQRHGLPMPSMLDREARVMLDEIADVIAPVDGVADPAFLRGLAGPGPLRGAPAIVAELERLGLLDKIEPHTHQVPHGDRSGVPIEPLPDHAVVLPTRPNSRSRRSRRWRAGARCSCRSSGRTRSSPGCATSSPGASAASSGGAIASPPGTGRTARCSSSAPRRRRGRRRARITGATRRWRGTRTCWTPGSAPALWPFSTLGWPEQTPELARYYPTDVLVTGFDIIFFWVARMMMMGLHFMGDVPFRTVYIHGLVRDERGQKMSKSKGNVIDPLELIDRYGADALRFTICALTGPGRDVKLGPARVESQRSFVTKIVERGAVLRDERHPAGPGVRSLRRDPAADALDSRRGEPRGGGGGRGARSLPHGRLRGRLLSFHLEPVLRLVPRIRQAGAGGRRDERRRPRCAARRRMCSASSCACCIPAMPFVTEELVGPFRLRPGLQPDPRALAASPSRFRMPRRRGRSSTGWCG